MEIPKRLEEEKPNKVNFDFTKPELEYILENANFTEEQEEIFRRLTDRKGRQSIVQISMEMPISESTVKRRIRQIKNKILRLL